MYKINDIFYEDEDFKNKAIFCNENKLRIVEIEPDNVGRRFQIQEIPEPTKDELARREIAELEEWFIEYDKQVQQYLRAERLGQTFDKDISKLDEDAVYNALRLKQLRG